MTKIREGFNFYRSYYDVAKELEPEDRYAFLWALLEKQFDGKEPDLQGMAKFAYISQKHSIEKQIKGWETKNNTEIQPILPPLGKGGSAPLPKGGGAPLSAPPCQQVQVQVQEKGEVEEETRAKKDGVFSTIADLKSNYLKDHDLISAVCKNQKLTKPQLSEYLNQFNEHLRTIGQTSKTWNDYTTHFLNWTRKKKQLPQSPNPNKRNKL